MFNKYNRSIDRMKLNLRMNMIDTESEESEESESEDSEAEENRMKELIDNWWEKKTIIGKILTFVYENEDGVNEEELKEYIEECGSKNPEQMYYHLTTLGKDYSMIFKRVNKITNLKQEARDYIDYEYYE